MILPLLQAPLLQRVLMTVALQRASELGIHYRGSRLAVDGDAPRGARSPGRWLRWRRRPRPGERAPDAPCVTVDGARTTLFDQFRGTHFTLLLLGGRRGRAADREALGAIAQGVARTLGQAADEVKACLVLTGTGAGAAPQSRHGTTLLDPAGVAHRIYHAAEPCLCLVRPDGYVGFRGRPEAAPALLQYLQRVFVPALASQPAAQARAAGSP